MTRPDPTLAPARPGRLRRLVRHRYARRLVRLAALAAFTGMVAVAVSVGWVSRGADGHVYTEQSVPPAPVGLVLGALVNADSTPSPFLAARLALAQRLYQSGKVRVLLVSGDNSRPDYDEPDVMKAWLVAHGVPASRVVADYAGFDTYDSCARAKLIFGVTRAIVVTQSFHVPRAVSLCRHLGIDATGVGDVSVRHAWFWWWRGVLREDLACVKAGYDLSLRRDPVFLGRHETGVEQALASG